MPKRNLRNEAEGRECQIRIPGVCNKNRSTVVLAHPNNKRLFGVGTGQKAPDVFGAWACSACHDLVDGRTGGGCYHNGITWIDTEGVRFQFYEGCFRTMKILLDENKIIIP